MAKRSIKTSAKNLLLKPAMFFNGNFFYMTRISMACARGALNVSTRRFDPDDTSTWEFSSFSQNGEDGIIDYLLSQITHPNRYFVEIGASDGMENNSSHLAFVKKYDGVMVEADRSRSSNARRFLQPLNWGIKYLNIFMTPATASELVDECLYSDPDFLSLDIDSNDFYIAKACLEAGIRPKVLCVEYNSAFGPELPITIPYTPNFDYHTAHPTGLYYGVSLQGWKTYLTSCGYHFVTVDSRGVNAFFVDTETVDIMALKDIKNVLFAENSAQRLRSLGDWKLQFAQIESLPFITIT